MADQKRLRIEYLYLDLNTCNRCIGTYIFGEVKESDCECCGEIAGTNIDCRVFRANGETCEVPTEKSWQMQF